MSLMQLLTNQLIMQDLLANNPAVVNGGKGPSRLEGLGVGPTLPTREELNRQGYQVLQEPQKPELPQTYTPELGGPMVARQAQQLPTDFVTPDVENQFTTVDEGQVERARKLGEEFARPSSSGAQEKIFYHGTKAPINKLSEADPIQFGNVNAIYGEGLYLTDNPNIAKGYAKRKGNGPEGKVLSGTIQVKDSELLNLDEEIPQDVLNMFNKIKYQLSDEPFSSTIGTKIYEELREDMADNEITNSEAVETFQEINNELWKFGYKGLTHTGGKIIKTPEGEHNVKILFQDPFTLKIDGLRDYEAQQGSK